MTAPWWQQRMLALDTETTAPIPEEARVVQACVAHVGGGQATEAKTWLANCAVEIPAEATAIHGITTQRVREEGDEPREVLQEMIDMVNRAVLLGMPIIICNAPYDLTVLACEAERHHLQPPQRGLIVDPFVLDKHIDKYRKGSRKLDALCAVYGAKLEGAHDAAFDAVAAARVAYRIGQRSSRIGTMPLQELQELQRRMYLEQAQGLNAYWIKKGDPRRVDNYDWPIRRRAA